MKRLKERIDQAGVLIRKAQTVVAFSGAGISTESGLSDFRSKGGLWDRYRMVEFREFLQSEEARIEYWRMRRELIPGLLSARPNRAHRALARLQEKGKCQAVITQNIDGLHQRAGSKEVIELHGSNMSASCLGCGRCWPIEEILPRLQAGEQAPHCRSCQGPIKPDTVSFGQSMPETAMKKAFDWAHRCDVMLMIGSSLAVHPAAQVPAEAARTGAGLIFINREPTDYDDLATVRFFEEAGEVMERIAKTVAG